MRALRKVVGANAHRRSRFHDENGRFVGWPAMRYLPRNIVYLAGIRLLGRYPELPWWPFTAVEAIEALLQPDWHVVEFGSGMSTLWLARRVAHLLSIEDDPDWYAHIAARLREEGLDNATYAFRRDSAYYDLATVAEGSVDLAVVDGTARWKCVEAVLPKMREGGYIYLDNSDADKDLRHYRESHRRKRAQKRLEEVAAERGTQPRLFNSLTVGLIASHEGMLVRV